MILITIEMITIIITVLIHIVIIYCYWYHNYYILLLLLSLLWFCVLLYFYNNNDNNNDNENIGMMISNIISPNFWQSGALLLRTQIAPGHHLSADIPASWLRILFFFLFIALIPCGVGHSNTRGLQYILEYKLEVSWWLGLSYRDTKKGLLWCSFLRV